MSRGFQGGNDCKLSFLYPAIRFRVSSRVPLAPLLFMISHKWRACSQAKTCGVPDRYIVENVAFLGDVVDLTNEYNLRVVRLSLAQENRLAFPLRYPG